MAMVQLIGRNGELIRHLPMNSGVGTILKPGTAGGFVYFGPCDKEEAEEVEEVEEAALV